MPSTPCHSHHMNPTQRCDSENQNVEGWKRLATLPDDNDEFVMFIWVNLTFQLLPLLQVSVQFD